MSRVDNIQARCEDGRVEIGLFEGEECEEVIPLRAHNAFELRDSLNDALREAGLLNRKTAAAEQHSLELLAVARDVVCTRLKTVDPVRFYERMDIVAERAHRAVETVDRAAGLHMPAAEREALAARPRLDGLQEPKHGTPDYQQRREGLDNVARNLVVALRATLPALERLGDFIGNTHDGRGASRIPPFDRGATILQARDAIEQAEAMLRDTERSQPEQPLDSSAEAAARRLVQALDGIGFGDDGFDINGAEAVNVIADHLPALRAALAVAGEPDRAARKPENDAERVRNALERCAGFLERLSEHLFRSDMPGKGGDCTLVAKHAREALQSEGHQQPANRAEPEVLETRQDCPNTLAELAPDGHPYREIVDQASRILGGEAAEEARAEEYDAHQWQQEQEHYRQQEGEEQDREDTHAGGEEDLGR